jgi:protein-S-isoprenylcysteine O-methyltransferase Ste14
MTMSHRTHHLPPLPGLLGTIREWRYRESARQGIGILLVLLYTVTAQPLPLLAWIGIPIAFVGMAFRLWASGHIIKNRELATEGPYAMVRHPLYTGNVLVVLGFAAANALWWAFPLAALFFWFYYPPAIEYEDRKLRELFEERWHAWAASVPALVPTFRNLDAALKGRWSFSTSARANGEVLIAVYLLVCMAVVVWRIG